MKILLVRHAQAQEREEFQKISADDEKRPLTPKGKETAHKVSQKLTSKFKGSELVITSPLIRAQETAEIFKQYIPCDYALDCLHLKPDSTATAFIAWFNARKHNCKTVVIIGHEPMLSKLASYLLTKSETSIIDLKKMGIILLEQEETKRIIPGAAKLKWCLTPKFF
jgi:phosphohistidine phosphatase